MAVSAAQVARANALPGRATVQTGNKMVCAPSIGEQPHCLTPQQPAQNTQEMWSLRWQPTKYSIQHQKSYYLECGKATGDSKVCSNSAPWCASTCSSQGLLAGTDRQRIPKLKIRAFISTFRITTLLGTFLPQQPMLLLLQEPTVLNQMLLKYRHVFKKEMQRHCFLHVNYLVFSIS